MTRRLLTTSLALAALALSPALTGCPSPVEIQYCETGELGSSSPVAKVRVSGVEKQYTSVNGEFEYQNFTREYPYDAAHGKETGDANAPLSIPIGDIAPIDPGHELKLEWLTSDGTVIKTASIHSLDAWPKKKVTRDGKEVEVYLVQPYDCPTTSPVLPTAPPAPATEQPPEQAEVVAALQGMTQTSLMQDAGGLNVIVKLHTAGVLPFLSDIAKHHASIAHVPTADDANSADLNWKNWVPGGTTRARFLARNGKALPTLAMSGGADGIRAFQFSKDIPDDFFVGDQCVGRIEWRFILPGGNKAVLIRSQDFVLAERATSAMVLRLDARATQNVSQAPKTVTLTATYKDGAAGLYEIFRRAVGTLPERAGLGYGDLDRLWREAGGQIDTHFQPGTLVEQDPNNPTRTDIGARQEAPAEATSAGLALTVPWPSLELLESFVAPSGLQGPVTGYVTRNYRYNDKTVVVLLTGQVDTNVKLVDSAATVSGGGSGAPVAPAAPTLTSVTPSSGVVGATVTIAGTNFRSGATVTIGGQAATVTGMSATSIAVTVPAGLAAGTHSVVVRNTDSTTVTATNAFTVPAAPTITGVAPNNGSVGSSTTISGTNFRPGATVTIGGVAATVTGTSGTTSITVTVPAGLSAAAHPVVVTNTDTTTVTSLGAYTVNAAASTNPTITSVTPNGVWTDGLHFTIVGTNFRTGATVTVGGTAILGLTVTSTQIDGTIPASLPSGSQTLVVTNTDNSSVTYGSPVFVPVSVPIPIL